MPPHEQSAHPRRGRIAHRLSISGFPRSCGARHRHRRGAATCTDRTGRHGRDRGMMRNGLSRAGRSSFCARGQSAWVLVVVTGPGHLVHVVCELGTPATTTGLKTRLQGGVRRRRAGPEVMLEVIE